MYKGLLFSAFGTSCFIIAQIFSIKNPVGEVFFILGCAYVGWASAKMDSYYEIKSKARAKKELQNGHK